MTDLTVLGPVDQHRLAGPTAGGETDAKLCRRDEPTGTTTASARLQSGLLRAGLAFVFSYATVAMLVDPSKFTDYMPTFLPSSLVDTLFLPAFSVFEALLAVCFATGRRLVTASVLAALTLAGIIALNPDSFGVLFRNVAIACAALSLAAQAWEAQDRPLRLRPAGVDVS